MSLLKLFSYFKHVLSYYIIIKYKLLYHLNTVSYLMFYIHSFVHLVKSFGSFKLL